VAYRPNDKAQEFLEAELMHLCALHFHAEKEGSCFIFCLEEGKKRPDTSGA
jgi:hypothetical protein